MKPIHESFVEAINSGLVCLHPTDTIPGLSFSPLLQKGVDAIFKIKSRNQEKTFVSLVSEFNIASKYWAPLPKPWPEILKKVWPGALTVIWNANLETAPSVLVSSDQTIAFRCPVFKSEFKWMERVLDAIAGPLPTTSVNISGHKAVTKWDDAIQLFQTNPDFYYPEVKVAKRSLDQPLPSTIIRIVDGENYEVFRKGEFHLSSLVGVREL